MNYTSVYGYYTKQIAYHFFHILSGLVQAKFFQTDKIINITAN